MEKDKLVIIFTVTLLIIVLTMIFVYVIFIRKKTMLLIAQNEKDLYFEKELATSQVEMKEQTLNYIGQELHDDLGQKLSVVRLRQNQLIPKLRNAEKEELTELNELLGECIQDIRNLSKTLITEQIIHFGLIESVEREIHRIKKLKLLRIHLTTQKHDIDISPKHGLIIFRIIQESINNILKHSNAKNVSIEVEDDQDILRITISDNGKGFNTDTIKDGSGLKNMELRAKLIHAEFAIQSKLKEGTKTSIIYHKNLP
ncbi:Signal transduction histidine-protein kinase/phosphatase DegS [Chryseobacterium aquaeductus]|uniref:histidine kinase n=1 Tax=Chryseobacterium aquaeductus TaxID=2675056 RepID=A0A9N8QUE0_9FLAO|nr:ATP-binding protein [Chryseobacterium aquaeductus]CAA7330793.1 Signal transduction histidine-protein kinase/phosphatase DegS [Chryseobacterium potabilaquae]CAD7806121.1 Signal transduction histidine-protein kinase/phosphatase DegS [Chryseobacterium aquaeductus]